ncbi:MAG: hypothetical protein HYT76_01210 [Deltaproteobacteria bacterium]|nr:hypothetical protein [Deltaproteobacteria bacterium]
MNNVVERALLFISLFLFSAPVWGSPFHLNTTLLSQVRQNDKNETEIPLNGYLGMGLRRPDGRFSGESDMRFFRDLDRSLDDYDLYQTVLHVRPRESFQIDFGRQFLNPGFSTGIIDGLQLTLNPTENFRIGTYGGIPRRVEEGDFHHHDQLLSGLFLDWQNGSGFQARLSTAWQKNDWGETDLGRNDEIRVGSSLSYLFSGSMRPLISGLVEYETGSKTLETGTLGVDMAPFSIVSIGIEGNYFNANRESTRRSILSLFSEGELITGRFSSNWILIKNFLDLTQSYSYQWMEVREADHRRAHLLEIGFPFSLENLELDFGPQYSFAKSFGGDVHGIRFFVYKTLLKKGYGELSFDYATYDKITSDNDSAFSTIVWTGYEFPHNLRLSIGGEYNRNNLLERDVRGSLKLEYRYGSIL